MHDACQILRSPSKFLEQSRQKKPVHNLTLASTGHEEWKFNRQKTSHFVVDSRRFDKFPVYPALRPTPARRSRPVSAPGRDPSAQFSSSDLTKFRANGHEVRSRRSSIPQTWGLRGGRRFRKNDAMQQEQYCTAAVVRRGGGDQPLIVTEDRSTNDFSRWMADRHLRAPRRTGSKGRELNSGALAYRMKLQSVPLSLLWRATKNSIG